MIRSKVGKKGEDIGGSTQLFPKPSLKSKGKGKAKVEIENLGSITFGKNLVEKKRKKARPAGTGRCLFS